MNWNLLLDYIRVFIWPTVTLVLGVVFKEQLKALSGRVQSVETPVGTVTLQNQARAIEHEATEIGGEIATDLVEADNVTQQPTDDSLSSDIQQRPDTLKELRSSDQEFNELLELTRTDPTAAILGAWRELEGILVEVAPYSMRRNRLAPAQAISAIANQGILPENLVRLAEDLRHLRNRVVHDGDVVLTKEGATSYVMAAHRVKDALALASTPQAQAMEYEKELFRRLTKIGFRAKEAKRDGGVDFYIFDESGTKSVGIIAKYKRHGLFDSGSLEKEIAKLVPSQVPVVLITNAPLTDTVQQFNFETYEQAADADVHSHTSLQEVVHWRDMRDDDLLIRALMRRSA